MASGRQRSFLEQFNTSLGSLGSDSVFLEDSTPRLIRPGTNRTTFSSVSSTGSSTSTMVDRNFPMDLGSSNTSMTYQRYVVTESGHSDLGHNTDLSGHLGRAMDLTDHLRHTTDLTEHLSSPMRFTRSISNIDYTPGLQLTHHRRHRTVSSGLFRYRHMAG